MCLRLPRGAEKVLSLDCKTVGGWRVGLLAKENEEVGGSEGGGV